MTFVTPIAYQILPALIPKTSCSSPDIEWRNRKKKTFEGQREIIWRVLGGEEGLKRIPFVFESTRLPVNDPRLLNAVCIERSSKGDIRSFARTSCEKSNLKTYDKDKILSFRFEEPFRLCINKKLLVGFSEASNFQNSLIKIFPVQENEIRWEKVLHKMLYLGSVYFVSENGVKEGNLIDENTIDDLGLNELTEHAHRRAISEHAFKILGQIPQLKDLSEIVLGYAFCWFKKTFEETNNFLEKLERISCIRFEESADEYFKIAEQYLNDKKLKLIFLAIFGGLEESMKNYDGMIPHQQAQSKRFETFFGISKLVDRYVGSIKEDDEGLAAHPL